MTTMTITEWWNDDEIGGELKARLNWQNCGYKSVAEAVKELSHRFKHRVVYIGKDHVVYDCGIYVQKVSFS